MARVEGSELLELPRAEVWRLLNDPEALGSSIPGCRGFDRGDDEHRYLTAITVTAGPVKGVYEGTVEYLDVEEPERCTIVVAGRGDKGSIDGRGEIELEARDGRTEVGYRGDFKLTGPIAGVGERLAPGLSRKMIVETLRNLERRGSETQESSPAVPASDGGSGAEPFKPLSIPAPAAFAAGLVLGLLIGVLL